MHDNSWHGQEYYGHFTIGLWPLDPNFTIGSIFLCLRNLERDDYGGLAYDQLVRSNNALVDALNSKKALDHHFPTVPYENHCQSIDQVSCFKGYQKT